MPKKAPYPTEWSGEPILQWADAFLSFLYPETCQVCEDGPARPREGYVCEACQRQVRFIVPPICQQCGMPFEGVIEQPFDCSNCRELKLRFDHARAAVLASGVVLEVIHRYKYRNARWFEPFLAGLLYRPLTQALAEEPADLLMPVPLHPLKQRERGFNQAEALAHRLGKQLGVTVDSTSLRRMETTKTQTLLTRSERTANVNRAFALRKGADFSKARIILIDDVLTTGATTSACAQVLRRAKAERIRVWTVARGV